MNEGSKPKQKKSSIWDHILNTVWDARPLTSIRYQEASDWGKEYRTEFLDENRTLNSETAEFLFERGLSDLRHAEDSAESLHKKCAELLKINTALIIGVFTLVRYFSKDHPMKLAMWSNIAFFIAILVVWRALAGVPKIPVTNVRHLAEWARTGDSRKELMFHAVTFIHRSAVANEYVNSWVSARLTLAWMITISALGVICSELFFSW